MAGTHWKGPVLFSGHPGSRRWHENMPVGLDTGYVCLWDDFVWIGLDSATAYKWDVTVKDGTASAPAVKADTANGYITMSSAATTDDNGSSIQGNEIFLPAASREIWFETKLASSDADDQDVCVGLTVNFATNPEAILTAANRIVFQINDGDASILCKTESGGTETSTDSGVDAVDATDITLGFKVTETSKVQFYVNRVLVATHTTNIPTTEMAVAAMQLSGSNSGTKSMDVDYLFAAQTR